MLGHLRQQQQGGRKRARTGGAALRPRLIPLREVLGSARISLLGWTADGQHLVGHVPGTTALSLWRFGSGQCGPAHTAADVVLRCGAADDGDDNTTGIHTVQPSDGSLLAVFVAPAPSEQPPDAERAYRVSVWNAAFTAPYTFAYFDTPPEPGDQQSSPLEQEGGAVLVLLDAGGAVRFYEFSGACSGSGSGSLAAPPPLPQVQTVLPADGAWWSTDAAAAGSGPASAPALRAHGTLEVDELVAVLARLARGSDPPQVTDLAVRVASAALPGRVEALLAVVVQHVPSDAGAGFGAVLTVGWRTGKVTVVKLVSLAKGAETALDATCSALASRARGMFSLSEPEPARCLSNAPVLDGVSLERLANPSLPFEIVADDVFDAAQAQAQQAVS